MRVNVIEKDNLPDNVDRIVHDLETFAFLNVTGDVIGGTEKAGGSCLDNLIAQDCDEFVKILNYGGIFI